jgi:hypothetical protein
MSDTSEVLFTVAQFAFLVRRAEHHIRKLLRDGKLKGVQRSKNSCWDVPESELEKFWGLVYRKPRGDSEEDGLVDGRR